MMPTIVVNQSGTYKKMRKYLVFTLLFLCTCRDKECKEWYTNIKLYSVTQTQTNGENWDEWYQTDFCKQELNLLANFYGSAEKIEGCKSRTRIHSVVNESTAIFCNNSLIIGNDTIPARSNIYYLFNISEHTGYYVYAYNKASYDFPKFESSVNTFILSIKLSDDKILTDSCLIKFN